MYHASVPEMYQISDPAADKNKYHAKLDGIGR